jgi:sulfofructose kinase
MRVLGIGQSNLDRYIVEKTLKNGKISQQHLSELLLGGTVPAALILLARHGVACDFITSLGRDEAANTIANTLRREGITLKINLQSETKINTIIDDVHGQRQKIPCGVIHTPIKNIDKSYLAEFDLIIVDRHERDAFYEVLAKKSGHTKIVIDPSTEVSDFTLTMMKEADYPIVPIESLISFEGHRGFLAAAALVHQICEKPFIVTLSDLGSLYYDGQHMEFLPALPIDAVDTCGAGDIYRGAFAYGVLQGWNIQKCAQYANVAAGLQCTKLGNVPAVPSKDDIKRHLQKPRRSISLHHVDTYFRQLVSDSTNDRSIPVTTNTISGKDKE